MQLDREIWKQLSLLYVEEVKNLVAEVFQKHSFLNQEHHLENYFKMGNLFLLRLVEQLYL